MYKPQNNGPHTMLAATINASQVSITVENASILPDAPNVLTIGTEEDAELVKLESKTGNILSVTRGFNGTTPKAWDSGAWIYRAITAQDIEELQERTKKIVKTLTAAEFEALTTEGKAALFASGVRVLAVEGDLYPDDNRYGYIINQDGTTAPLSDPHALKRGESVARADVAANAEMLGGMLPSEFAKAGETGGVTMELLWENASPTSDFEGQDVALDLSEYDGVFIIFDLTGSNNYRPSPMFVFEKDTGKFYNNFAEAGYKLAQRNAAVYSNKVTFGNASSMNTYGSQGSTNNKLIKPVYIYGIKGVVR